MIEYFLLKFENGLTPENFNPASVADRAALMAAFKQAKKAKEEFRPVFWKRFFSISLSDSGVYF